MNTPHLTGSHPWGKPAIKVWQTELQLNHGNHLGLRAAQDMRLSAVRGVAWVTVELEAGETMVGLGQVFVIASGKTALVGPLHQSVTLELGIAPNARERAPDRPMLAKLRRLLGREDGPG